MDTRLLMAGGVAAVGLILLVPTFNALNASYVQDVPPPPWMPTPPDMTPPTNFKPPTGMTPPTNWEGEMPPQCPPPVFVKMNETVKDYPSIQASPPQTTWRQSLAFEITNGTLAVGGYVNFTNWQAQRISAELRPPTGPPWGNSTEGDIDVFAQPVSATSYQISSYVSNKQQPPKPGTYTLVLTAELGLSGRAHTEFLKVLACGGLLS